jgi:hypothetical protein
MDRRKFLIGMGSLAAGGAAASGTGAFSAARLSRSASVGIANDSNAFIQLATGGAEGAQKRVERTGGEFQIDFGASGSGNGVNDDSRYQIGAMDDDAAGDQLDEGTGSPTEFKSLYDEDTQPAAASPGTPYAPDSDTDQSAFVVRNRSGQLLNVQIGYRLPDTDERSNEDDDGAILFLQGHASAIEAGNNNANTETDSAVATGAFDFAANSGQPGELDVLSYQEGNVSGNEALPAGEEIYVSLQVDTTRAENEVGDLDGSLVVSAEKAALPTSGG